MSFFEYPQFKTRKQRVTFYGLVLLEVVAISFIIPSASSTGELAFGGCATSTTIVQCGNGSCNILDTLPFQYSCSSTVTFNPAFANPPKYYGATFTGTNGTLSHPDKAVPATTVVFESGNGTTWHNMPVAKTEIYGNPNHEFITDLSNVGLALFGVNCLLGSTSTNATLRPEYSINSGATWNELAATHTFLDLNVGSSATCAFTPPAIPTDVGPFGIASAAKTQGVFLRIVGISGSGAGDNPIFNNIEIGFYTDQVLNVTICIPNNLFACPVSPFAVVPGTVSKTSMKIIGYIPFNPLSTYVISFTWIASE